MGLIRLKNATSGQNSKLPVKYPPPWPKNFRKYPPPPGNFGHSRCLLLHLIFFLVILYARFSYEMYNEQDRRTYHTSYMTVEACRRFVNENQIRFVHSRQLHSDGQSFEFTTAAHLCPIVRHITDHQL